VNQNNVIDILDVQLTAGKWNQSGTFTSGSWDLAGNAGAFVLADSNNFDLTPGVNNALTARFTGDARFILGINASGADPSVRRMGPMAQDFYAAFGLGDDDTVITTGDLDRVALASIQGLHQIVQEKDAQIAGLQEQIDGQQGQIDALLARMAALEQAAAADDQ
jgi:hypothetical protein